MMQREKFIAVSFLGGVLVFIILISMAFITGQTFGQRCSAAGYDGFYFDKCVSRLSDGGRE